MGREVWTSHRSSSLPPVCLSLPLLRRQGGSTVILKASFMVSLLRVHICDFSFTRKVRALESVPDASMVPRWPIAS